MFINTCVLHDKASTPSHLLQEGVKALAVYLAVCIPLFIVGVEGFCLVSKRIIVEREKGMEKTKSNRLAQVGAVLHYTTIIHIHILN